MMVRKKVSRGVHGSAKRTVRKHQKVPALPKGQTSRSVGPRVRDPQSLSVKTLAIILACMVLLTVGAVLLFFSQYVIYKVYDVKMELEVSDRTGFNVDTDYLNFGKAMPSQSNQRTIVMSHSYDRPLRVHFRMSGNISRFVVLPEDFFLEPEEQKEVAFTAIVPKDAKMGEYVGDLRIYFRRI